MLRAGFGMADITPALGAELKGYHSRRFASGVLDPIHVRAFVLDGEATKLAVLVFDLMAVEHVQTEAIRAHLSRTLGLPGGSVIVSTTHTHTAPVVFDFFDGSPAPGYVENTLLPAAEQACRDAIASAAPFILRFGRAVEHSLAFCRRYVMKGGGVVTNPPKGSDEIDRPESEIDHDVQVLAFESDGEPTGLLVNANNHSDTIGGDKVSADWLAWMARALGEHLNRPVPVMLLNGPEGNINHYNPDNPANQVSYKECERIGRGYARFVIEALEGAEPVSADPARALSEIVEVPYRRVSQEEVERAAEVARSRPDTTGQMITANDLAKGHPYWKWIIARELIEFDRKYGALEAESVELCGFRMGECAFVGLPGEPFSEVGMGIKSGSPFERTCVFALCGDMGGYIPMPEHFGRGGYEPLTGGYNRFAPEAAELFIEGALKLLAALK